ncbi:hypothetical protein Nmel_004937, partial [Mimus melanotis]
HTSDSRLLWYRPLLPCWALNQHLSQPRADPGQASAMRILYLLLPLLLLLVHSAAGERDTGDMAEGEPPSLGFPAAGSSLAPTNKKQCEREKGYCGFLKCSFPYVIKGKCSRFFFCCKNLWG